MSLDLDSRFDQGIELMREVLGDEFPDSILKHIDDLRNSDASEEALEQARFGVAIAWGYMFHRSVGSLRDRSIAMLAADVVLQGRGALEDHVRLALHSGLSPEEIREVLFTLIIYVGFPMVRQANEVITPILDEFERNGAVPE